ncbi:unnamed protein product [Rotaria sp. Silwood2]|nr:unnamed protein product [Rotaria sp. Silwood2]CAF4052539.1 unnamed protein product [Rotaria sp. Silwood2]CAF4353967.1 unnamed protein product [Rotaria sp. Silwood2]
MYRAYFAQYYAAKRHPNIDATLWGQGFPGKPSNSYATYLLPIDYRSQEPVVEMRKLDNRMKYFSFSFPMNF